MGTFCISIESHVSNIKNLLMRNKIFKIANKIGIPYFLKKIKGGGVTVLSLHRISTERDFFFDPIDPKTFENLIQYCIRNYDIVSFSDIGKKTKKQKLILSFDDGYYDFVEYAIPILTKYNLPSNHNLINSCLNNNAVIWTQKLNAIFNFLRDNSITNDEIIDKSVGKYINNWTTYYISFFQGLLKLNSGERNSILETLTAKYNVQSSYRMMNWEDAKQCIEKFNVEIGCHTYNHESLFILNKENELDLEIGKSIEEMEENLNRKINILALPNGQFNDNVLKYAKNKGIKYTLLVDNKVMPQNKLNNDFNLISRINIVNESIDEVILRTELFHSKIRKFA